MKTPMEELFEKFGHLLPDIKNEYLQKEKDQTKKSYFKGYQRGWDHANKEACDEIKNYIQYNPNNNL